MREAGENEKIARAAEIIRGASYLSAFTGAGISVESGIPPFRGNGGVWEHYDSKVLEIDYFLAHPAKAWPVIREIFYDHFAHAGPNDAHLTLARFENAGMLRTLITQNIDDLHFRAGSRNVIEFHGNSRRLVCLGCRRRYDAAAVDLSPVPPRCAACGEILKPDFVFFGESIPAAALLDSERCAARTDVMLLIGTTGEVYPAASIPRSAAARGAYIIEINPEPSLYSSEITGLFLQMPAGAAFRLLSAELAEGGP